MKPEIDNEKCTNCGTCIEVCPVDVIEKGEEVAIIKRPNDCIGCRACEAQCPESAITVLDD